MIYVLYVLRASGKTGIAIRLTLLCFAFKDFLREGLSDTELNYCVLVYKFKAILLMWFCFVLCIGVESLCCFNLMYVFIFLVKFKQLSGHLLGKKLLT